MRWPERSFIASEEHGFLYMPIEKVACSSIKQWIIKIVTGQDIVEMHEFSQAHLELQTLPSDKAERLLRDPSLFRFAIVRNPWDRLVSAFTNKFVPNKSPAKKFLNAVTWRRRWRSVLSWITAGFVSAPDHANSVWSWNDSLSQELTFREFVGELGNFASESYDQHWRPQYLSLSDQQPDFLGRFENLSEDFAQICRHLKIKNPLPHRNQTPRQNAENTCVADWTVARLAALPRFPDYIHFYSDDLVRQVGDLYHEDVSRFSYDFVSSQRALHAA